MDDLQQMFGAPAPETQATVAPDEEKKVSAGIAKAKQAKAELTEQIKENPNLAKVLQSMSDSLKVTNTLGFGVNNNIVNSKDKKLENGKPAKEAATATVGYLLENCGNTPINYRTEVFAQGPDGIFVGTVVERTAQPGEKFALSRKYLTMLACQEEFSFTLQNGTLRSGSGTKGDLLERFYFVFDKECNAGVNDDNVKIAIDVEGPDGSRVVKPEFVETFGYLNNPEVKKVRAKRESNGVNLTAQDLQAYMVRQMLQQ